MIRIIAFIFSILLFSPAFAADFPASGSWVTQTENSTSVKVWRDDAAAVYYPDDDVGEFEAKASDMLFDQEGYQITIWHVIEVATGKHGFWPKVTYEDKDGTHPAKDGTFHPGEDRAAFDEAWNEGQEVLEQIAKEREPQVQERHE